MAIDRVDMLENMAKCFPHTELKKEGIAVYLRLLSDIPAADLQLAIDDAICESEFLPSIALIRQCYEDRWRERIRPENWIVGAPPVKQLPAPEAQPIRLLREIWDLVDAPMELDGETVHVQVSDVRVAEARLTRIAQRTLASAGLMNIAVQFVPKGGRREITHA